MPACSGCTREISGCREGREARPSSESHEPTGAVCGADMGSGKIAQFRLTHFQDPFSAVQRGAALAERNRLQPGEPVAAAGAAKQDRQLVADELAARLVKTGGRLVKHARYYWLVPAQSQPNPGAAAGAAKQDRQLVADELAARLVKTGGRLVKHARYYWLLLAESHLTRRLFASMLRRILALPLPAG